MYQDETEKELEENGFRITEGEDEIDIPEGDMPEFGGDDDDDPDNRFH